MRLARAVLLAAGRVVLDQLLPQSAMVLIVTIVCCFNLLNSL